MAESIFVVFAVLYFLVATKVEEWYTISLLGFRICTPEYYLLKPHLYHYTSWGLFWFAALSCIWFSIFPCSWGVLALLVLFVLSGIRGQGAAFKTYRLLLGEMLETAEDEGTRSGIAEGLRKTNSDLRHDLLRQSEWRSGRAPWAKMR